MCLASISAVWLLLVLSNLPAHVKHVDCQKMQYLLKKHEKEVEINLFSCVQYFVDGIVKNLKTHLLPF